MKPCGPELLAKRWSVFHMTCDIFHMKYGKRLCLLFTLFAFFVCSSPSLKGAAEQSSELRETYDLAPGGVISVSNTSGYIHVTSWSENRVKVDAVKRGRRDEDAGQIEIQVTPRPGRIDIRTIYPRNEDSRISVDYDLKVPRGAV